MDLQTIDTYNKTASVYDDETDSFWKRFPRTFLDKFISLSGDNIVDIGSGPGRDGLLLQEAGKSVVCIDASKEMVASYTSRGLSSLVGNFEHLPWTDLSFDGVWSYTALLHVPKASIATPLKEIHRVLKPSGVFALGLIEGDTEGYKVEDGNRRWFSFYQPAEVITLAAQLGFTLVYFETFRPRSKNYFNFIFQRN